MHVYATTIHILPSIHYRGGHFTLCSTWQLCSTFTQYTAAHVTAFVSSFPSYLVMSLQSASSPATQGIQGKLFVQDQDLVLYNSTFIALLNINV
eukprot:2120001-Ditylum_brightwellii.AAC.1